MELIMVGCLVIGAFYFFGPVGIIVAGILLMLLNKK